MPVDRTYVKRKRIKKRLPSETVFKRNDIAWALWIERDGLEAIKINTRPLIEKDLKRSSTDFEEKHEVISAFLVVVNGDSTKKGTSVTRVQNKYSSIHRNRRLILLICISITKNEISLINNKKKKTLFQRILIFFYVKTT